MILWKLLDHCVKHYNSRIFTRCLKCIKLFESIQQQIFNFLCNKSYQKRPMRLRFSHFWATSWHKVKLKPDCIWSHRIKLMKTHYFNNHTELHRIKTVFSLRLQLLILISLPWIFRSSRHKNNEQHIYMLQYVALKYAELFPRICHFKNRENSVDCTNYR